MGKTKKVIPSEQAGVNANAGKIDEATTTQVDTRLDEATKESEQHGGIDTERQKDSSLDQKCEKGTVDTERFHQIAEKTFCTVIVDVLYFTSDDSGFASITDAKDHAEKLKDKSIVTINR